MTEEQLQIINGITKEIAMLICNILEIIFTEAYVG